MIQQLHPITRLQKAGVKRPIEEELLSRKKIKSKFMVFKSSHVQVNIRSELSSVFAMLTGVYSKYTTTEDKSYCTVLEPIAFRL